MYTHLPEYFVICCGGVSGPPSNPRISWLVKGIISHHSSSVEVGWQDKVVVLHPFYDCQSLGFNLPRPANKEQRPSSEFEDQIRSSSDLCQIIYHYNTNWWLSQHSIGIFPKGILRCFSYWYPHNSHCISHSSKHNNRLKTTFLFLLWPDQ